MATLNFKKGKVKDAAGGVTVKYHTSHRKLEHEERYKMMSSCVQKEESVLV